LGGDNISSQLLKTITGHRESLKKNYDCFPVITNRNKCLTISILVKEKKRNFGGKGGRRVGGGNDFWNNLSVILSAEKKGGTTVYAGI